MNAIEDDIDNHTKILKLSGLTKDAYSSTFNDNSSVSENMLNICKQSHPQIELFIADLP